MNHNDFAKSVSETLQQCCDLLLVKSGEYAENDVDRLAAFKQAAALERTTPQRALFGMVAKHLVSLQNMSDRKIKDYSAARWSEKIGDTINYMLLLKALVDEEYQEVPKHEKH